MRITTFLMLWGLLQVSAKSSAQLISLSGKNMPLMDVLNEIHHQSGYDFIFVVSAMDKAQPVSVDFHDLPLDEALSRVFAEQPLGYDVEAGAVTVWMKASPRSLPVRHPRRSEAEPTGAPLILAYEIVKGRIVDSLGQPLIGASVRVINAEGKRTALQTKTDHDGYFLLRNVPDDAMFEITYVGYVQRTLNAIAEMGNIILKSVESELQEVEVMVNTGYQSLPKERATGSFVHIDNKLFNQQTSTNVLERLEAVTSSLVVDRSSTAGPSSNGIRIRGLSTITGPKDALIIVDNFPYDGDINNINPNDVENITVLRDAAAASIWGASAGNGVIVITTKRGKADMPLTVESNNNITIGAAPNLQVLPWHMNSADFIDVEEMLYQKGYYNNRFTSQTFAVIPPVVELLRERESASSARIIDIDRQIAFYRNHDVRDDYRQYVYQQSINQQYHLGIRGGSQRMTWSSAVGYDHNTSVLADKGTRLNLRFHQEYKPFRNLKLATGFTFTQSGQHSGKTGYGSMRTNFFSPYLPLADENGNPAPHSKYRPQYLDTAGNGKFLDWYYYPLEDYKHDKNKTFNQDFVVNSGINYEVVPGIQLDVKYLYERQHIQTEGLQDEESFHARDQINSYSQIRADGNVHYIVPKGGILNIRNNMLQAHNLRGQLNISYDWDNHEIVALVGGEARAADVNGNFHRYWGYNSSIMTIGNIDYTRNYLTNPGGSMRFISNPDGVSEENKNYISAFANASYTFKKRYIISGSARRDASNLFGLNTNDQWNPFWSAGFSWNLSDEDFYRFESVPHIKLRSTYGFSGNIDPSMAAVTTMVYFSGVLATTQTPQARFATFYNPELQWETSKILNLALDFRLKSNRVSGSIEYFHKKGTNLFGRAELDYTVGIGSSITKNVASMKSNGVDLILNTLNINQAFRWSSTLNFSYAAETVMDFIVNNMSASNFLNGYNGTWVTGMPGTPVNAIYGYRWAGLDSESGNPLGYFEGEVTDDYLKLTGSASQVSDLRFFGSAIPTKFGSFLNSFSYKGFTLDMSIIFKLGYYFRRPALAYNSLYAGGNGHVEYQARWQKPGDELKTHVPSLIYPANNNRDRFYQHSEKTVEQGDHIRFQYINFAYALNPSWLNRISIKQAQLFLNVSNLGILWRANDLEIDPDYIRSQYQTGLPRRVSFGLKFTL